MARTGKVKQALKMLDEQAAKQAQAQTTELQNMADIILGSEKQESWSFLAWLFSGKSLNWGSSSFWLGAEKSEASDNQLATAVQPQDRGLTVPLEFVVSLFVAIAVGLSKMFKGSDQDSSHDIEVSSCKVL